LLAWLRRIHGTKLADGTRVDDIEAELKRSMTSVAKDSRLQPLISFLYVLLDKLVKLLIRPPVISGQIGV